MQKIFNPRFKRFVHEIYAGAYGVTREPDVVFSAVLGSCISVCLRDRVTGTAGMNHFMLPGKPRKGSGPASNGDARYGAHSMGGLIDSMLKIGANKNTLEAKIFGGGQVYEMTISNVAVANIDFIKTYLKAKNIPVLAGNMGGRFGRKIYFFPDTFDVYVKRINIKEAPSALKQLEKRFLHYGVP